MCERLPNPEKKLAKGCREQVTKTDMAKVSKSKDPGNFGPKGSTSSRGQGEQQTATSTARRP